MPVKAGKLIRYGPFTAVTEALTASFQVYADALTMVVGFPLALPLLLMVLTLVTRP